jgi:hypothetical protein
MGDGCGGARAGTRSLIAWGLRARGERVGDRDESEEVTEEEVEGGR